MKNKKRYIIIVLCFVIWGIVFVYLVNNENLRIARSVTQYVLIDKFNLWKYSDLKWEKLDSVVNYDDVSKEINWKKYNIYVNNQYFNTLDYVLKDGVEYYFDDDIRSYEINQEKILLNEDSYLKLKEFYSTNFKEEDIEISNEILLKYNHSSDNLTVQKKYLIDEENAIYIFSNYPSYYPDNQFDLFYFVFYRRNSKNYLLLDIDYVENVSSYKLSWVMNTKSKYDNFILSYTCEEATCYDMYEYQKGKYAKVIGTLTK